MHRALTIVAMLAVTGVAAFHTADLDTVVASEFYAGDGEIVIASPWVYATDRSGQTGATYMTVTNTTDTMERLTGASSSIADRVELHTHVLVDEVMTMQQVDGGIELPPGENLELAPHGLHIMLFGLDRPLVEGETFPLRLVFEHRGETEVIVEVAGPNTVTTHMASTRPAPRN